MIRMKKTFALLMMLVMLLAMSTASYADIYMQINGVEGESMEANHQKWIEIDSYRFGYSKMEHEMSENRESGGIDIGPLTITKMFDASTPRLFDKLKMNEPLGNVKIAFTMSTGDQNMELVIMTFKNAELVHISTMADSDDSVPMDELELTYHGLKIEYPMKNITIDHE